MTLTRYDYLIGKGILSLYGQGNIDPSISEIACEAFKKAPPDDPLVQPDTLGGEVYAGVKARIPKLRRWLEEHHGMLTTPISASYYTRGLRGAEPVADDVAASMPNPGRPMAIDDNGQPVVDAAGKLQRETNHTMGIRFVAKDKEDLFFQRYVELHGVRAAAILHNKDKQLVAAHQIGAITSAAARTTLTKIDTRLGTAPKQRLAQIGNGEDASH